MMFADKFSWRRLTIVLVIVVIPKNGTEAKRSLQHVERKDPLTFVLTRLILLDRDKSHNSFYSSGIENTHLTNQYLYNVKRTT